MDWHIEQCNDYCFLSIIIFLLLLTSCISNGEISSPDTVDIFDKFTARRILAPDVLPNNLTAIRFFPANREFLALGKAGQVFHLVLNDTTAQFLGSFTIPEVAPAPVEIGLTGIAFDPDFESNRYFYLCYTTGDYHFGSDWQKST